MEKPISILIHEARQNITGAVNNSGLPPCLLQPILKDMLAEINILCQQEYQKDMEELKKNEAVEE